jgi:Uma2 family endonuclease
LLLVEIAYTSEDFDRDTKVPLYAAAGIREYWIVNLNSQTLEVYQDPQNGVYANTFTVPATGTISPLAAPQSVVLVADLLP